MLSILQTALELGLIGSLTVLALFLSYTMLGVCDLSTDGCFTLGAAVGAVVGMPLSKRSVNWSAPKVSTVTVSSHSKADSLLIVSLLFCFLI